MAKKMKKEAEILVECGYKRIVETSVFGKEYIEAINPYYVAQNTSAGELAREAIARRQADAIEDWLEKNNHGIWIASHTADSDANNPHQWRLDRIKWCIKQLEISDE